MLYAKFMDKEDKNLNAVALGKLGGKKLARDRGPEYYSKIQAMRKKRKGGRPKLSPKATHSGSLKIGTVEIPCYVLENGERVLSTRGIMKSLKRTWRGRKYAGTQLPVFLEANNLKPFVSSDMEPVLSPVEFRTTTGAKGEGYKAEILPAICEVYLRAKDEGKLTRVQETVAKRCEILIRGFSRIGIVALVDEATGYQYDRTRLALEEILEQFVLSEFRKWVKRFPDEFYREIFRLRGWAYREDTVKRTPLIGKLTTDLVYDRLAPGVRIELEKKNPKNSRGRRKHRHHQWLTEDVGDPRLREHLASVITLMRVSENWPGFKRMLNKALPKYLPAPLFDKAESLAKGMRDS